MATTNPPPLRGIPQELATFLRQLWDRTGGANDAIADSQVESFVGISNARIQALRQELSHTRCQLANTNAHIAALRKELDYLHTQISTSNGKTAGLQQQLNDIEVKAWL